MCEIVSANSKEPDCNKYSCYCLLKCCRKTTMSNSRRLQWNIYNTIHSRWPQQYTAVDCNVIKPPSMKNPVKFKLMHHNHSILQVNVHFDGQSHDFKSRNLKSRNLCNQWKPKAWPPNSRRNSHYQKSKIYCKVCHPDSGKLPSETKFATRLLIPDPAQEST